MTDTAPLLSNELPSYRDATTLQFDHVGDEEFNRDVAIAPSLRHEVGHQMEVSFPEWSSTNVIMSISPLIGIADEIGAYLRPNVGTTLQVRAEWGRNPFCCFAGYDGRKITIGNLIQGRTSRGTLFVERCSFVYPKSHEDANCIDLVDPDSDDRIGWIITSQDVAAEAKIGLHSDPVHSPRFTTSRDSEDEILILNPEGQTLATGKVTRSSTYCGFKAYKGLRIILPQLISNQVSDAERTLIFAALIVWALNLRNYKKDENNCLRCSAAAIAVLLCITFLGILIYVRSLQ